MKSINVTNYLLVLLGLLFFAVGSAFGQSFVSNEGFVNKIAKDIVVVEFWVEWNSSNEFSDINKLKDCDVYRVDIGKDSKLQQIHNVSAVPTLIIFENGNEKERFKPNIMFQLDVDKKTIQHSIDTLILNRFQ
tara:strand:- start:324 stop:722 length:399 start_codon:yes stop_codon:yes gene_type:complete